MMTGSGYPLAGTDGANRRGSVIGFGRECLGAVLQAAAAPGSIVTVADGLSPASDVSAAAFAACSALMAAEGRLWLSTDLRRNGALLSALRFQCGAAGGVHSGVASCALLAAPEWDGPDRFRYASASNPYASTTVIIEVSGLRDGGAVLVHREDDDEAKSLDVIGLDNRFWLDVNRNFRRAPYGLDFLLAWRNQLVAVTRYCFVTQV